MEAYIRVRELGRGAFGVVSVVKHIKDGQLYVMKEIDLSKLDDSVKRAALNEAQLLSSLKHPCIVGYVSSFLTSAPADIDAGGGTASTATTPKRGAPPQSAASPASSAPSTSRSSPDSMLVIIMDHCAGGDLGETIRRLKASTPSSHLAHTPPFPEDQILDWFIQLSLALKYIHSHHILHRDLKVQNVFLTQDRKVKLGDFGISKTLNSEADFTQTVIGTPYYLSPEVVEGRSYGKKSDIWCLGLFLYELCTLNHAFDGSTLPALINKIIRGQYTPIGSYYSQELHALIAMMLSLNPSKRPNITQILRLKFVQERMKLLSKKYPEFGQEYVELMKVNSAKELFVQNLAVQSPMATTVLASIQQQHAHPQPTASIPIPSPNVKRTIKAPPPASASHKPPPSSSKRTAAPVSSTKAVSVTSSSAPRRKSTVPPAATTAATRRVKTPPPPTTVAAPVVVAAVAADINTSSDDDSDSDGDSGDGDETSTGSSSSPSPSKFSSSPNTKAGGGGAITSEKWFNQAAEAYAELMENLAGAGGGNDATSNSPAPLPAILASADDLYDSPSTPHRKAPLRPSASVGNVAAAHHHPQLASHHPSHNNNKQQPPATVAPATRTKAATTASQRRKSDGTQSLAVPNSNANANANVSTASVTSTPAASSSSFNTPASSNNNPASSTPSPLQAMLLEIETQKGRVREWKRAHAAAKMEKRKEEMEVVQRHKEKMKMIRKRGSLAPEKAAAQGEAETNPPPSESHDILLTPPHHHNPPTQHPKLLLSSSPPSSSPVRKTAGGLARSPQHGAINSSSSVASIKSPAASSSNHLLKSPRRPTALKSPLRSPSLGGGASAPASANNAAAVGSPSPAMTRLKRKSSVPSPTKFNLAAGGSDGNSPASSDESKQSSHSVSSSARVSVRDFISARKKEAAAAAALAVANGQPVSSGPSIEVVTAVTRQEQKQQSNATSSTSSSTASSLKKSSASDATTTATSTVLTKQKSHSKREINFELVLQPASAHSASSSAQNSAPATAAGPSGVSASVPTTPVLHPAADSTPMQSVAPLNVAATSASTSTSTSVSSIPPRHLSRASSDNMSARQMSTGGLPMASPMSSQLFTVEYASPQPVSARTGAATSAQQSSDTSSATSKINANVSSSANNATTTNNVAPSSSPTSASSTLPSTASSSTTPPVSRATQLSYQITQARQLCCSMLGDAIFQQCYSYLRQNKAMKKQAESTTNGAGASACGSSNAAAELLAKLPSEAEQERVVKSWFKSPEQSTAYSHIQSLIFCEDLMKKM